MAQGTQNRPESPAKAQDPSENYERAHPARESPQGTLDRPSGTPVNQPDRVGPESTSRHTNRPNPGGLESSEHRGPIAGQPDHSMKDEEPMGWDQAPADIQNPRQQRQPRTEGKGGVD